MPLTEFEQRTAAAVAALASGESGVNDGWLGDGPATDAHMVALAEQDEVCDEALRTP